MHSTLTPGIKGFVDENHRGDSGHRLKGWCFHEVEGILPLRLQKKGATPVDIPLQPSIRMDVVQFYQKKDIQWCGWNVEVSEAGEYVLEMYHREGWEAVFTWAIPDSPVFHLNTSLTSHIPSFLVVDNFYEHPDSVRKYALTLDFQEHKEYHKGKRTDRCYRFPGLQERFEYLLQRKINDWNKYGTNGCFQFCVAGDQLVYHIDSQEYAGLIFLTPNAPPQSGTRFYRSKKTHDHIVSLSHPSFPEIFQGGFLDSTQFELVDQVGNVYNRLVLFRGDLIHAAAEYFGSHKENGRLFQLFFFDIVK